MSPRFWPGEILKPDEVLPFGIGGGNVRQLTTTAGAVTDSYEYDAYGNVFATGETTPNSYLYRGEQYDSDLGLYYLRARYYNPATGRFMSRDPEDGKQTDPASLHKYHYAGGDPINLIDPTGRAELFETVLIEGGSKLSSTEIAVRVTGYAVTKAFCTIAKLLARATLGVPPGMSGIPGGPWPGPAGALCTALGF